MQPTEEQEQVILAEEQRLLVDARAGSGKSTCLRLFAEARPLETLLYLAFNKSVRMDASRRMPSNTKCLTTHGLCWHVAVKLFGGEEQAREKVGNTYPSKVARRLRTNNLMGTAALATINAWCASADPSIAELHIPDALAERIKDLGQVVDAANIVWNLMLSADEPEIKLPHDGYLKLASLEGRVTKKYTSVLVDEFQDLNLASLAILEPQTCRIVGVGDPYQQILQFRGSVNGMRVFSADARLHLTRSFRFGQGIADLANLLLERTRREQRPIIGAPGVPTHYKVDKTKPFAVLARTNGALIERAVEHFHDRRGFVFVGGVERYRLDLMLDAYHLWRGEQGNIRDAYLRSFNNIDELDALARDTKDAELSFLVRVVANYGKDVPAVVDAIKAKAKVTEAKPSTAANAITFSTVHKAKGLEWKQVVLADDFAPLIDKNGNLIKPEGLRDEDVNLHYVAVTRACETLEVGQQLAEWARHASQRGAAPSGLLQGSRA